MTYQRSWRSFPLALSLTPTGSPEPWKPPAPKCPELTDNRPMRCCVVLIEAERRCFAYLLENNLMLESRKALGFQNGGSSVAIRPRTLKGTDLCISRSSPVG